MARYARIAAGCVVEIIELPSTITVPDPENERQTIERPLTPADVFHPDIVRAIVLATEAVEVGWLFAEEEFSPPAASPAPTFAELVAYAADRRWQSEVAGIIVAGIPVATDDRSKLMITGARVAAMADPGWSTVWHGADGQTYPVNAAAMVVISGAVQSHVNSSFATFAAVKAEIEANAITTFAEIDAAFADLLRE